MSRGRGSALVTVLFTDIVGSTEIASELGNRRWRELLGRHHRIVRRELRRFGGREIDTAGDGFFATFDRPAQGIRCAWAVSNAVRALGIEIRAGLHVGEAELMGKQVGGVAVHVGARIGAQAGPGEVLVSGTLRDLVPGAGIEFQDRGWRDLKGVAEPQRLFAVAAVDGEPRSAQLPGREASRRRAEIVPPQPLRRRSVLVAGAIVVALAVTATALFLARDGPRTGGPGTPTLRDVLIRIDGETGRVGAPIPLAEGRGERIAETPLILIGEGAVWVRTTGDVFRVDPETGEPETAGSAGDAYGGGHMALGLRAVWLASSRFGGVPRIQVVALNPATLDPEVDVRIPATSGTPEIATTDDSVWVGYADRLVEFNPQSGEPLRSLNLGQSVDQLVGWGPDLWVVDSLARGLFRFDPDKGEIVETIGLQLVPDELEIGEDGQLWVLNQAGGILLPVTASGDIGTPISVGGDPSDLAVSGGTVWVADHEQGAIREIDPLLGEIERTVKLGGAPAALAIDSETGDVWVYLS
jgi:class 3 adenylate cyclase